MLNFLSTRLSRLLVLLLISGSTVFSQDQKPFKSMLPQSLKATREKQSFRIAPELSGLQKEYQQAARSRQAGRDELDVLYKDHYMIRGEQILVELIAENTPEALLADMTKLPFEEVAAYQRMVSGWLDIKAIDRLDGISSLRFARAVRKPHKNVGAVTSQGDLAQRSSEARKKFGVKGKGSTVGILSDSYNFLRGADEGIASGDLPGPGNPEGYKQQVKVLLDADAAAILNPFFAFSDEGRAMAEIIHDVAPAAGLAFHTAFLGQPSFASGIIRLQEEADCDVIVDDVIYFEEPFFQDGIIAQAADEVSRRGATYFSSAGNNNRQSYESKFRPSRPVVLGADPEFYEGGFPLGQYVLHDFDPGPGVDYFQKITFPGLLDISFQWDNSYASACMDCPGAASDLDIFIALRQGDFNSMYDGSMNSNIGADPIETLAIGSDLPQEAYIVIGKWVGAKGPNPNPTLIKYVNFGSDIPTEHATHSATTYGHANAEGAIAVGAVPYFITPAFGVPTPVPEPFSSAGGIPIFYDPYGNRIEKNVRKKPEVCGPDGGNTTFFFPLSDLEGDGFPNFFGTSASAPHVAGIAALMQEAASHALHSEHIETLLTRTAIDMDDPFTPEFDKGFDFGTGYGFVRADEALRQATGTPRVSRLLLVDADTDTDLQVLKEGDRIILSELGTKNLAIRAETDQGGVGSIKIALSGAIHSTQTENYAPYASFGDDKGNLQGKHFSFGSYKVKAVPYSGKEATGQMGLPLEISFLLIEKIESFTLVYTEADIDLENLSLYNEIFPAAFNNELSIRANTSSDKNTGSVRFVLRNIETMEWYEAFSRVENYAPYALFGDQRGDYKAGHLPEGLLILEATPFSGQNAEGTPGERLSVILNVISPSLSSSTARTVHVYPNPVSNQEQLQIDIQDAVAEKAHVALLNLQGEILYESEEYAPGGIQPAHISLEALSLRPGVYFLRVTMPGQEAQTIRLMKK